MTGLGGRLGRSVVFRIASVYALIFGISVVVLFAFFYWSTVAYLTRASDVAIEAEVDVLAERYRVQGLNGLRALILERLERRPAGPSVYLLATPDLRALTGNLDRWPRVEPSDDWIEFRLGEQAAEDASSRARARVFRLPGDYNLLVGRDMQELDSIESTIGRTLAWGLLLMAFMAVGGGVFMSRNMERRVADINDTIRRIMAGELSRRLPIGTSGDEFDRLVGNLNRMLDRIEELMDGVRQVSDNLAHDLRTPLARLRNRLERLRSDVGDDSMAGAIDEAIDEADGLLSTFGALLRIARIEARERHEGFAEVDLTSVVGDVCELYEPLAEQDSQVLSVETDASVTVFGDSDLMFQALVNLVDNAVKYTPAGGHIVVALRQRSDGVTLSVGDDGPGIPEAVRAKVFDRFFRLDASRSSPGSGLGLSLVAAVVKMHDAIITLEDNDPGLRVTIRFRRPAEQSGRRSFM